MFFSALLSAYNELLRLTQRVETDGTVPVENELKAQICSRSRILLTQAFFSHRQGTFAASKEINFHKFLIICTPSMRLTINHRKKKFEMRKSTQNLIRGKFSVEIFSSVMRLSRDSFSFSDSQSISFPSASASEGVQ